MKPYKVVGSFQLNLDCGAELLDRYQVIWKELYDEAEVQGKRFNSANYLLENVASKFATEHESLKKFYNAVDGFAHILQDIQDVSKKVALLEKSFEDMEVNLIALENICKDQEFQRSRNIEIKKLETYRQQKEAEIERFKVHLQNENLMKAIEKEKLQSVKSKERQSTFEEAFTQDVDFYKSHGYPERPVPVSADIKKLDLSEVEIEQDSKALDDFLGSTTTTPVKDETEVETPVSDETEVMAPVSDGTEVEAPVTEDDTHIEDNPHKTSETETNTSETEINTSETETNR